jgi:hypothetical protein
MGFIKRYLLLLFIRSSHHLFHLDPPLLHTQNGNKEGERKRGEARREGGTKGREGRPKIKCTTLKF